MKLRCPCCCNEVAPVPNNYIFTVDMGAETSPDTSQEHLSKTSSVSVGPFGLHNENQELPTEDSFPDIRVETHDDTRSLSRTVSIDVQQRRSDVSIASSRTAGRLRASLQMLLLSWIQPMDNKANTKLFGSAKAVKKEQTRHKAAGWIIHPCSAFR